ncbi:MAG: hypothetical protein J3K34DRAFT_525400 [Monoraphidium minutum]|nr:MAG: hypothetical protein J3K34DRAFT_525400 [Monoraphidium minutum]
MPAGAHYGGGGGDYGSAQPRASAARRGPLAALHWCSRGWRMLVARATLQRIPSGLLAAPAGGGACGAGGTVSAGAAGGAAARAVPPACSGAGRAKRPSKLGAQPVWGWGLAAEAAVIAE